MDVVYSDTETTSLRNPHFLAGRRTWEAALIRETADGQFVAAAWIQLVDVDVTDAARDSLQIGRFHDRFSPEPSRLLSRPEVQIEGAGATVRQRGVDEREAARIIEELTRGAVIAGSNPGFDTENFAQLLHDNGQPADGWWHHPRDVPNVANGWLLGAGAPGPAESSDWDGSSYSTGKLSEACGVPVPEDRHSAMADALWMRRWDHKLRGITPRPKGAELGILPG